MDGYEIKMKVSEKTEKKKLKPEPSIVSKGEQVRFYKPFNEKALFRIFADLGDDDADIINFANKYGFLGDDTDAELNQRKEHIEPLSRWRFHIQQMKAAVELWDHIQQKDSEWLARRIVYVTDKVNPNKISKVKYIDENSGPNELIAKKGYSEDLINHLSSSSTDLPARITLQRRINEHLKISIAPELLFDDEWRKQSIVFTLHTLISVMWLQLSQSVEGDLKYRKCIVCTAPFHVDPSERGKPRQFCSGACKAKNYRENKKASEAIK